MRMVCTSCKIDIQKELGFVQVVFLKCYGKIDFPISSQNGLTPLHIAAHYGHVDIAELLLNRSADTDARARVRFFDLKK